MALTRNDIKNGAVQRMVAAGDDGVPPLSESELAASRRAILSGLSGGDVWLFAYGSLMWNPAFHYAEKWTGRVYGYHRRFCLWTLLGRGSRANPGLILGLDHGGSCRGVVYRVAAAQVESELEIVWRREMVTGSYLPRWVDVRPDDGHGSREKKGDGGSGVRAVTFVINRTHPRYAGLLSEADTAAAIAPAEGALGPCSEYLFNTVGHLEEIGIHDRALARLRARVAALS